MSSYKAYVDQWHSVDNRVLVTPSKDAVTSVQDAIRRRIEGVVAPAASECFDLVDEKTGMLTGEKELRSVCHDKGLWHRAAHLWLYAPNGKMLMQLRGKDKDVMPNVWDIGIAGHIDAGENADDSVVREAFEESGLLPEQLKLRPLGIRKVAFEAAGYSKKLQAPVRADNREFMSIYAMPFDGELSKLKVEKGEAQQFDLYTPNEVRSLAEKSLPLVKYFSDVASAIERLIAGKAPVDAIR